MLPVEKKQQDHHRGEEGDSKQSAAKSLQSGTTERSHRHSPPGSSVSGVLQARTLEWVAISFSTKQNITQWGKKKWTLGISKPRNKNKEEKEERNFPKDQ